MPTYDVFMEDKNAFVTVGQLEITLDRAFGAFFVRMEAMVDAKIDSKIEWLATSIQRQFIEIDKRFDRIETRLDKIEFRLDAVEMRLDAVEIRLDKIEIRLDGVEKRLDLVEVRLERIEKKTDVVVFEVGRQHVRILSLEREQGF